MKFRILKSIVTACLAAILITAPASAFAADGQDAVINNKNEVIYATLTAGGSVNEVYAVNHFDVAEAGSITDYGEFTSVVNLTNTQPITQKDGIVTCDAEKGNFYYQGNMAAAELPWIYDISYRLDGVETEPYGLTEKSGSLEIRVTTRKNDNMNTVFYDNYMQQISITLDTEKCENIEAKDATIAKAGKNTLISYTVMPGKNADISVSADVTDFVMDGIEISAIPFNIGLEMPDTDGVTDDMTTLSDAINDLNDGVKELTDGVGELNSGGRELADGSNEFKKGLSKLNANSTELTKASTEINKALSQISASLNDSSNDGSSGLDLGSLMQLPDGLYQLAKGLDEISGGMDDLKSGYSLAYAALDSAISEIPAYGINDGDIYELNAALTEPGQQQTLSKLLDYYASARKVKGTYDNVKQAFGAVETGLGAMSGSIDTISRSLSDIAKQVEDALSGSDFTKEMLQLANGLSVLSKNYGQFDKGLNEYMDGISALASGYAELDSGVGSLSDGIGELYDGTRELYGGTSELNDEVADLPETIELEIDKIKKDYDKSDFDPVSFISSRDTNISLVQFVIKTEGVKAGDKVKVSEPEPEKTTFWDRLAALFNGNIE